MATDFCLEVLLDSKDFAALAVEDQRDRLVRFCARWFDPGHKLDTVDHVRLTARLRQHSSKAKVSVGEVIEMILPSARRLHAQEVVEREAARIKAEDERDEGVGSDEHRDADPATDPDLMSITRARAGARTRQRRS